MADELLQKVQDIFEGQIDFMGQKQTESISTILLAFSGAIAFIVGYLLQDIYITLWVGLAGAAFTFFIVVPPYPFYKRSPEEWLPKGNDLIGYGVEIDGKKIN